MKAKEIQRINFISKSGFIFDYQHIAAFLIGWLLILFCITGFHFFRLWYVRHDIKKAKMELAALMQDQERRLAMLELTGPKVDREKQQDLIQVFRNPTCWSCIMDEVQIRVLRTLKINLLRTSENKETGRFRVLIDGESPSMSSVIEFLQRLQLSPLFKDVVLLKANRKKDLNQFKFNIEAQVLVFNAKRE